MIGVHRMLLHAWRLAFVHPLTGELLTTTAPWDAEWEKAMRFLGWDDAVVASGERVGQ